MGLSTIIDKSAFQAFNEKDIALLYRYYMPNIPPILVMEILADLSKEFEEGKVPADKVQLLANKLLPINTAVNANYLELIREELRGGSITMDHRPFVGNGTIVRSPLGEIGMKFTESSQQISVRRWKDGYFTKVDELIAEFWRSVTKQEDLLENLKKSICIDEGDLIAITSLPKALAYVDAIFLDSGRQKDLLTFALAEFGIDVGEASAAFLRWEQAPPASLESFAPYTAFCVRVVLLFHVALKKGLVATRPTNQLDLEYLFYLPFCKIFITNDKFQKSIALLFLTDEQAFVDGKALKQDFKQIEEYLQTVSEPKDLIRLRKEPPQIPDLLSYQLWKRFLYWPNKLPPPSAEDTEKARKKMEDITNAIETGDFTGFPNSNEVEFITMESYYRPTDPCPCGSGKPLKDCHLPPQ